MTEVVNAGVMAKFTKLVLAAFVEMETDRLGPGHEQEAVESANKRFDAILDKLPRVKGELP